MLDKNNANFWQNSVTLLVDRWIKYICFACTAYAPWQLRWKLSFQCLLQYCNFVLFGLLCCCLFSLTAAIRYCCQVFQKKKKKWVKMVLQLSKVKLPWNEKREETAYSGCTDPEWAAGLLICDPWHMKIALCLKCRAWQAAIKTSSVVMHGGVRRA